MVNLFDIVTQAQRGAAVSNFAHQFGLSPEQTMRAMEALLPAFSLGFQRSLQNPTIFGQLLDMMSSGRYAPFFDGAGQANFTSSNGQQVLDKIFGSGEVSRQVAAQASAVTGIGAQVLQQMMPALAPVLIGGLARFASVEGLADFLRNWSDWLRTLAPLQAPSRPASNLAAGTPYGAWSDLMGAMLGQSPAAPPPQPTAADPWTGFMQGFLGNMPQGAGAPPPPAPPPSQPNPFEVLSQMFETGREVQAQYLSSLHGILDDFWRAQDAPKAQAG